MASWLTADQQAWQDWQASEQAEPTAVESRFVLHHFVSRSKGSSRGTKRKPRKSPFVRKKLAEVDLVADKWESKRPQKYTSDHLFPYDVKATEVFANPQAESARLREQIMRLE